MQLDDQTIEQFERDGVVLLREALSPQMLDLAFGAWQWSTQNPGPLASGLVPGTTDAFQDLCNPDALSAYEPLVLNTPLASIAQQLWRGSPVWFLYEQVFHKRAGGCPRTPWHQDTSYWSINGAHLISFWISFEAIPQHLALEFVRGSHLGPLYNTSRFDPADPTLPIFEVPDGEPGHLPALPDIEADRGAREIIGFASEPGDVIAFHTSMLHGGGATDAATPERRTLTLRFFGEQCFSALSPGPPAPFGREVGHLEPGAAFRHERFLQVIDT